MTKEVTIRIGRPLVMTEARKLAVKALLTNTTATVEEVAKRYEVTAATIYRTVGSKRYLQELNIRKLQREMKKLGPKRPGSAKRGPKPGKKRQQDQIAW